MKRKKKSGSGGANWMDTYGDMVTLLLCFFVMLFSMSKMDESKWIALVQALNPSAVVNGTSMEEPPEGYGTALPGHGRIFSAGKYDGKGEHWEGKRLCVHLL